MNDLTLANCQLLLPNHTVGTGDLDRKSVV